MRKPVVIYPAVSIVISNSKRGKEGKSKWGQSERKKERERNLAMVYLLLPFQYSLS
jgi:hypothetical protein